MAHPPPPAPPHCVYSLSRYFGRKFQLGPANRQQKLSLIWRNRKKISQIINDYLCLLFFLLIILCVLRAEHRGLVWRNRKKISQIIKDYFLLTVLPLNYFMGQSNWAKDSLNRETQISSVFLSHFRGKRVEKRLGTYRSPSSVLHHITPWTS